MKNSSPNVRALKLLQSRTDSAVWADWRQWCAGQANGMEIVKLNGQTVYSSSTVKYVMDGKHGIEKFTFRSFHGGSSPQWASPQDQYI